MPVFRGEEKFSGSTIMLANSVKGSEQLTNRNILVIDESQTAVDMAITAAIVTNQCDMIFRCIHMILPLKILRSHLPIQHLLCRFYSFSNEPYPLASYGRLFQLAHSYFPSFFAKAREIIAADSIVSNGSYLYVDGVFQPQRS
jgi:hypothetical protein